MTNSTFLTKVVLRNYKSIAACDVQLCPLVFLVGPNGAGKSNFLDALRFVADALRTSLDHALRDRGGIKEVRRRSMLSALAPVPKVDTKSRMKSVSFAHRNSSSVRRISRYALEK